MPNIENAVIVCGYPKSGTTWATRLIAQLLDMPSAGYWGFDGQTFATEGNDRRSSAVCYQAHQLYGDLMTSGQPLKLYYITRDPRDIVASGMFHFNFYSKWTQKLPDDKWGRLPQLLKKIDATFCSKNSKIQSMLNMLEHGNEYIDHCHWGWNEHVNGYLRGQDVFSFRYEDLLLDGLNVSRKIVAHAGLVKEDQELEEILENQSFKVRKAEFESRGEKIKFKHLRKGKVGDWRNHLKAQHLDVIEENHGPLMQELLYI